MSAAERLDVKESEDLVAFEELEGGDFSCLRAALAGRVASWRNLNRGRWVNDRGRADRTLDDSAENTGSHCGCGLID